MSETELCFKVFIFYFCSLLFSIHNCRLNHDSAEEELCSCAGTGRVSSNLSSLEVRAFSCGEVKAACIHVEAAVVKTQ